MIACLSPSDRYLEENISTLNYATRASYIANQPTKNVDPKTMIIQEQKKKLLELEKELKYANSDIQVLKQMNDDKTKKMQQLEEELKALKS